MVPFDVGSFVRLVVPADRKGDCFTRGRIVAHEIYRDDNGTRSWWYVRWFNDDGKPDSEPMKHAAEELEAV